MEPFHQVASGVAEMIRVVPIEGKGRGVITTKRIYAGDLIDVSSVVLVPQIPDEGQKAIHPIEDYQFNWDETNHAVVMGPLSFCNHSDKANCTWAMNQKAMQMEWFAIKHIQPGEELTIDYDCKLWFEPV